MGTVGDTGISFFGTWDTPSKKVGWLSTLKAGYLRKSCRRISDYRVDVPSASHCGLYSLRVLNCPLFSSSRYQTKTHEVKR